MKFKSNGTKAKRPLEHIQKTWGAKKKSIFFCFPWGFCMDFLKNQTRMNFPGNRMEDGFSWGSNGDFFCFLRFRCRCVFQPGSKIMDLGFMKFKSNGTTAKRPLEQIQKTQGAKKNNFFLVFLGSFAWIFLEIKRG